MPMLRGCAAPGLERQPQKPRHQPPSADPPASQDLQTSYKNMKLQWHFTRWLSEPHPSLLLMLLPHPRVPRRREMDNRKALIGWYYLRDWKRNGSNGYDEMEDERKENEKERCYGWKKWRVIWCEWKQRDPVFLLKGGASRSSTGDTHPQHSVLGGNSSNSLRLISCHLLSSRFILRQRESPEEEWKRTENPM
ncbi:hypothetical protein K1719_022027 [Acacia pycnantha]|nr:hypothetical protein K1719_022027 [Acacia pycnantha]